MALSLDGEMIESCTIAVTDPVRPIHARIPVIPSPSDPFFIAAYP